MDDVDNENRQRRIVGVGDDDNALASKIDGDEVQEEEGWRKVNYRRSSRAQLRLIVTRLQSGST